MLLSGRPHSDVHISCNENIVVLCRGQNNSLEGGVIWFAAAAAVEVPGWDLVCLRLLCRGQMMVRCCCCGGVWVGPCWSEVVLQEPADGSLLLLWRCLGGSLLV